MQSFPTDHNRPAGGLANCCENRASGTGRSKIDAPRLPHPLVSRLRNLTANGAPDYNTVSTLDRQEHTLNASVRSE
jgi:hypothetical protein